MDRSMLLGFWCRFHDSFNVNFVKSLVSYLLDMCFLHGRPTSAHKWPTASCRIPLLIAIFRPTSSNPTLVKLDCFINLALGLRKPVGLVHMIDADAHFCSQQKDLRRDLLG